MLIIAIVLVIEDAKSRQRQEKTRQVKQLILVTYEVSLEKFVPCQARQDQLVQLKAIIVANAEKPSRETRFSRWVVKLTRK